VRFKIERLQERYISHAKMRVNVGLSGAFNPYPAQGLGNKEARTSTTTVKSAMVLA